jgi:hypothetical protein
MAKGIESSHQEALFQWLKHNPLLDAVTWHIPNGGKRDAKEAVKFKRMGVKAGVPDIFMAIPSNSFHGMFIELKANKNKLTKNQVEMIKRLEGNGYYVVTCYSWDEARKEILSYLNDLLCKENNRNEDKRDN